MTHEAPNDQPLTATGAALRAHLDATAESKDSVSHYMNSFARLLADRLDGSQHGASPDGYVMATQLLIYDCKDSGTNGFTGEPMPSEVTGLPPMVYGIFQGRSIELAGEAFGKPFGDAVKEVYAKIRENMETSKAAEIPKPKLTPEQIESAFSAIANGDAKDLEAIDKTQAYEVLKQVEGVDPVEAILDGHPQDIPQEGWVVSAKMGLGSSAVIEVFRYGQGAEFKKSEDWKDSRAEHGEGAVYMSLRGNGHYTILYESPEFPQSQRNREPYDRTSVTSYTGLRFSRTDITDLENGGRILDEKDPVVNMRGYSSDIGWTDIDRLAEKDGARVNISRVTDERESAERIVAQLGYAMGMDGQGLTVLTESVKAKTQKLNS